MPGSKSSTTFHKYNKMVKIISFRNKKIMNSTRIYNRKSGAGFTLVELLTVAAVIIIMSSVAYVEFNQSQAKTRDKKRIADLQLIQNALERYRQDNGKYPGMDICPAHIDGILVSQETEHSTVSGQLSDQVKNCVKYNPDGSKTLGPVDVICTTDAGCNDYMKGTGWVCEETIRSCRFMEYLDPYISGGAPLDPVNKLGYFKEMEWPLYRYHQYNEATYRYYYSSYLNYAPDQYQNVCFNGTNFTTPLCDRFIKKCIATDGSETGQLCFDGSPCSAGTCEEVACPDDNNCRGNCQADEICKIKIGEYGWGTCPGYSYYILSTHMETKQSDDFAKRCCSCPSRPLPASMTSSIILQQPLDNLGCVDNPNGYAVCGFIPTNPGGNEQGPNPYQP